MKLKKPLAKVLAVPAVAVLGLVPTVAGASESSPVAGKRYLTAPADGAYPMASDGYVDDVKAELARDRGVLAAAMKRTNVSNRMQSVALAEFDRGAASVVGAAHRVAADGVVTYQEDKLIDAMSDQLELASAAVWLAPRIGLTFARGEISRR